MRVVFDAEPLVASAFDEPGAREVEGVLADVYDGEIDGYVTTIDFAELRYVASRRSPLEAADAHINDLTERGGTEYEIGDLWQSASKLKARYGSSLGDAYAVAAAKVEERQWT